MPTIRTKNADGTFETSETPLCYPCAVHQLGQSEMDRREEASHGN
jgi:hypothetical protein